MKFIVSSTELLKHLQAIGIAVKSTRMLTLVDVSNINRKIANELPYNSLFNFNESLKKCISLLNVLTIYDEKLHISKYEKNNETLSEFCNSNFERTDCSLVETTTIPNYRTIDFQSFISGSTKELIRRLALYTGHVQSTLLRVLRNARIHSLSIFFGLCCSRSGYIFDAITGSSSHPAPTSL